MFCRNFEQSKGSGEVQLAREKNLQDIAIDALVVALT
jgi:hypothetical protein